MSAHPTFPPAKVKRIKEAARDQLEAYYGKMALLQEYEMCGVENEDTIYLRERVRKLRVLLSNRGAL